MAKAKPNAKKLNAKPTVSLRQSWLDKLEAEKRVNDPARKKAQQIIDRYRDDKRDGGSKFNILWANVQVLKGALYSATPKPDVRRRFLDADPVSRETAAALERAIGFSVDNYDFDGTADLVLTDYLLPGYAQARVRYKPYFQKVTPFPVSVKQTEHGLVDAAGEEVDPKDVKVDEAGQQFVLRDQEKVYEEVTCEPIQWDHFRWQPGKKRWEAVDWACIDHYLTKEEAADQFGEIAKKVSYSRAMPGDKDGEKNIALFHEIFDKRKRRVVVVSPDYKDDVVANWEDPLNLVGFYPFPKPLFATQAGDMMPLPDFHFYQDQADELDCITARIDALVDMLKVRGVYDQTFEELVGVLKSNDGELTPVKDFYAKFADAGGKLDQVIAFMPLKDIAEVLAGLYTQRDQIKQAIYEITGIADIVRGQTDASETLGAQELKGRFADMRLSTRRARVNAFFRDIFRLKSEIIAEHFSTGTLKLMSGVEITPEMDKILKSDVLRAYKIDVETESTMAVDAEAEQKGRTEALAALTTYLERAIPAVQAGVMPKELAKELALFVVRGFRRGRQLEDVIERMGAEQQDPNNAQAIQEKLSQATQQVQQLQQQLEEGMKYVQELESKIQSKQVEEQSKTAREREQMQHEERMQAREQAFEQRMKLIDNQFELVLQKIQAVSDAVAAKQNPEPAPAP